MSDANIIEARYSGREIDQLLMERIIPAVANEPRDKIILAAITLAITLMKKNITTEELVTGVRGCSEWIVLYLSTTDEKDLLEHEKRLAN